jgi:hypothetical protein
MGGTALLLRLLLVLSLLAGQRAAGKEEGEGRCDDAERVRVVAKEGGGRERLSREDVITVADFVTESEVGRSNCCAIVVGLLPLMLLSLRIRL